MNHITLVVGIVFVLTVVAQPPPQPVVSAVPKNLLGSAPSNSSVDCMDIVRKWKAQLDSLQPRDYADMMRMMGPFMEGFLNDVQSNYPDCGTEWLDQVKTLARGVFEQNLNGIAYQADVYAKKFLEARDKAIGSGVILMNETYPY